MRLLTFLFALLGVLPLVVFGIIIAKIFRWRQFNQWLVTFWSRFLCHIIGLEIKIYGQKPTSPVMIVANHVSWLDIPIIHSFILAGFVAKKEIKYWPILGWLAMAGDSVFHQRGSNTSRKSVLQQLKKRLQNGRSVVIFPEGTVTDGSYLRPFHRQLIHAAVVSQTPVVPVAIKFLNGDGKRNKNVIFIDDETFMRHVFRILKLPQTTVEIHCGPALIDYAAGTRAMTAMAHHYIEQTLYKNDYIQAGA